jgi:hypothetical protein
VCLWRGCEETTKFGKPLPPGWTHLLAYGGATQVDIRSIPAKEWNIDAVVCPKHARALYDLMKVTDVDMRELENTKGRA